MNPIVYFISSVLIAIIVPTFLLIARIRANKSGYPENCFRQSKSLLFPAFWDLFIIVFALVMMIQQGTVYESIPALVFSLIVLAVMFLLSVWLILITLVRSLILEDDAIYYTNIFGIQKKLEYLDINRILIRYKKKTTAVMEYVIVFKDKKKISIDYLVSNFSEFQRVIKNRIKRHGGNVTNIFVEKYTLF